MYLINSKLLKFIFNCSIDWRLFKRVNFTACEFSTEVTNICF